MWCSRAEWVVVVLSRYLVSTGNPLGTPSSEGCWKAGIGREGRDKKTFSADLLGFGRLPEVQNIVAIILK